MKWIEKPCENCGKLRKFKYSENLDKVYAYKPLCKKCTLTKRNKEQNFSKRKYPIVDKFEHINTQEKAYLFGFLFADGSLCEQKRKDIASVKSIKVQIQADDIEICEMLTKYIGGSFVEDTIYDKRTNKNYSFVRWQLHSKEVFDNLTNLGCKKHSKNVPDNLFSHYLRGVIDGDGNIRVRERNRIGIKITSCYDEDWSHITDRIPNPYSIKQTIRENTGYSHSDLNINGNLKDFLTWLYKDATLFLRRKYDIARKVI